jgi:GMP synthase-like glutamine amidotransferase
VKIAVLDLTGHPEPLLQGMPRVGAQIIAWLSPALSEADYFAVNVEQDNEPLPDIGSFDGLVVSGSEHGVYDDRPWMTGLRQLLLETRVAGKPIYGICFGHQIMADTFGGKAEKSAVGNVVGARRFAFGDREFDAHVWHKDQVTVVPPEATVTATAAHCPVGALAYDFPAASIQFHPEYTDAHLREIFDRSCGIFLSADEANGAVASFEASDVKADLMAAEVARFFRKYAR